MGRHQRHGSGAVCSVTRLVASVVGLTAVMQTVSLFAAYPRRMAAKSSLRAGTAEVGSSHLTRASELAEGARKTIAYAVSVTADGSYVDGAAVLAQSCIRVHRGGASRYGVDLVAFVAPKYGLYVLAGQGTSWGVVEPARQ